MALDRFAAYILAKNVKISPVLYSQNRPRKNGLQNVPKMHFLLSLLLLRFPPKKAKCVVSARKSRQQIGLKAYIYMVISNASGSKNSWFVFGYTGMQHVNSMLEIRKSCEDVMRRSLRFTDPCLGGTSGVVTDLFDLFQVKNNHPKTKAPVCRQFCPSKQCTFRCFASGSSAR